MYAVHSVVDEWVVSQPIGLIALHAGALVKEGCAVLLPGSSHAGKSTFVEQLVRDGWTYYSDEYALIDNAGWAHAYPRTIFLRGETGQPTPLRLSAPSG